MVQLTGQHSDCQREVTAQPVDHLDGRIRGAKVRAASEPGQKSRSLVRRQGLQAYRGSVVESAEMAPAGDQDQAARGSWKERFHLLVAGGVVQQQQNPLARQMRPPQGRAVATTPPESARRRHPQSEAGWPARQPRRRAADRPCGRATAGRSGHRGSVAKGRAPRGLQTRSCRLRPFRRSHRCLPRRQCSCTAAISFARSASRPVKFLMSCGSTGVVAATDSERARRGASIRAQSPGS